MLRKIIIPIVFILIISACSPIATPLPLPTDTATVRPTRTLSSEERTEAAFFDSPTLPASFTPTFTATITSTPTSTFTPTATFTPTVIPEEILCEEFSIGFASPSLIARDELEDIIQIYLPYPNITISGEIRNLTTDEIVEEGTLQGGQSWTLDFTPALFPEIGRYEWVFTLSDATRTGICEKRGTFETSAEELGTPAPEMTAESTVEPMSESTEEILAEATADSTEKFVAEFTAEATEEIVPETTAEPVEMTEESIETPVIFPPR